MMTNNRQNFTAPFHPNAVEENMDSVQQQALDSLGLTAQVQASGIESLSTEQAAQVGQAMADRLQALDSNINMQSE